MQEFIERHSELLKLSQKAISDKKLNIEPSDLVNDAYIYFSESETPFSINAFAKFIYKSSDNEVSHNNSVGEFGKKITINLPRGENCCKRCNETKPISEFPIIKRNGKIFTRHICKECYQKQNNKQRIGKYYHNTEKQKIARKQYYQKQMTSISDTYIIRSILKKGGKEPTDKNIKEIRQRILQKRKRRLGILS